MMKKIAFLISGGVDSSVGLSLLKEKEKNITAFYLKIWLEDELSYLGSCPWEEDLEFVKKTCTLLDIPLQIVSLQKQYKEFVTDYVIETIKNGATPNPDIFCNRMIKFGYFNELYGKDYDHIATGHYASLEEYNNEIRLKISADRFKDQTYFLGYTHYEIIKKSIFPLSSMKKSDVRAYAAKKGLPAAERKDSQGICFLGKISFKEFIKHHCGTQKGMLIEYETNIHKGYHEGVWFYTIGQRGGIGLSGGPWYVIKKDYKNNKVFISRQYYSDEKKRDEIAVNEFNWLTKNDIFFINDEVLIKVRHGESLHKARVIYCDHQKGDYKFLLEENDQGIAQGQFAVIYNKEYYVYGAGVISNE